MRSVSSRTGFSPCRMRDGVIFTLTPLTGRPYPNAAGHRRIAETLRDVAHRSGVEAVYLAPVLKCIGIGMVSHMAAQICRDAQQSSTASAVELCGALCALYVSLPLIRALLAAVEKLS